MSSRIPPLLLAAGAFALACACASPRGGSRKPASRAARASACPPPAASRPPPLFQSNHLVLDAPEQVDIVAVFPIQVDTREEVRTPIPLELTVVTPDGAEHRVQVMHHNTVEVCPNCLPSGPVNDCQDVRCFDRPTGGTRVTLPHGALAQAGDHTLVLHRPDTGERLSRTLRVGRPLSPEACALPEVLGSFRRIDCRQAAVPLGVFTLHWGQRARYTDGHCRADVYALPLSDSVRFAWHEGPLGQAARRADATPRRAWMGLQRLVVVDADEALPRRERLVDALLAAVPPAEGEAPPLPACGALGPPERRELPAEPRQAIVRRATLVFAYELNAPVGLRLVSITEGGFFHRAGFHPKEVLYGADGVALQSQAAVDAFLQRLGREGRVEIVSGRGAERRCVVLSLLPPAARR